MTETLKLSDLEFEVRRSTRRLTLGLTVDRTGALVAHVPTETSTEELSCWIQGKLLYQLAEAQNRNALLAHGEHPQACGSP